MADTSVLTLFYYILGVLIIATAGGEVLRLRYGKTEAIANFQSRTYAWWVMVAVLAVALVAGRTVMLVLYAALSAIALYEFVIPHGRRLIKEPVALFASAIIILIQYGLIWIEWYGLFAIFIPVYGLLFFPILAVLSGKTEGFLSYIAEMQYGFLLAVFCLSHVPALLLLDIPGMEGRNILLLAFLVLVVQSSDILQYLCGKSIGRHKLAPSVSPSKTIEGLVGGVASACAVGVFFAWLTPFSRFEALLISFLVATMGFFGGFVLSAIKRDRGAKDWGALIPGHGGILDRVDSLLFAAPVYFHVVRYWWSV